MKLSTKGRYGLRAVVDIATHGKKEAVAISSIAKRQDISTKFLEQLIAKLKKADIVSSTRGAQGGYRLTRRPEEISVGEVLRALEGSMNPVECGEGDTPCARQDQCVTKIVWERISDSINETIDHLMLSDLIADRSECCDK